MFEHVNTTRLTLTYMVILTPDYMYMTASYPSAHKHIWFMVLPIDE